MFASSLPGAALRAESRGEELPGALARLAPRPKSNSSTRAPKPHCDPRGLPVPRFPCSPSGPLLLPGTEKTHTHPWDRGSQPPGSRLSSPLPPLTPAHSAPLSLRASNLAPRQQDVGMRGQCPAQSPGSQLRTGSRSEKWALQGLSYKPGLGAGLGGPWGSERAGREEARVAPRSGVASLGTPG